MNLSIVLPDNGKIRIFAMSVALENLGSSRRNRSMMSFRRLTQRNDWKSLMTVRYDNP
jgi:hypothetical protein